MPLFKKSQAEIYTPKALKISGLFQTNVNSKKRVNDSVLNHAKEALRQTGYTESKISEIITKDTPLPISKLKEVAQILNQAGVYGFTKNPKLAIATYVNRERVKAQSIARIRKEHVFERSTEEGPAYGTTSLSTRGRSPNTPTGDTPMFIELLEHQSGRGKAAASLSGKSNSAPTSSLSNSKRASSSLTRLGGKGSVGGLGNGLKPKF